MQINKTVSSGMLVVSARFLSKAVDVITLLMLTRLLEPADFGKFAIASSLVAIIDASLEFPINQALLSKKNATKEYYNTAFTLAAIRGLLLFSITNLLAIPYTYFYQQSNLHTIIFSLSFASFLKSFSNPALAFYQKKLIFWRDVVVESAGKLIYLALTTLAAVLLRNYWAFMIGAIGSSIANVATSYLLSNFRPQISVKKFSFFWSYTGSIAIAQVIGAVNWQSEKMLIGKIYNSSQLGFYSTSSDIAQMPLTAILNPLLRPLLATFAQQKESKTVLRSTYIETSSAIMFITLPILVGISVLASNIVFAMFGAKWLEAIPLLELLALSILPGPFAMAMVPLALAFGRSDTFLTRSLIECGTKLPLMIVGLWYFGLYGVMLARLFSEVFIAYYSFTFVRAILGISLLKQVLNGWKSLLASLSMVPAIYLVKGYYINQGISLESYALLIGCVLVGFFTYLATSIFLWIVTGRQKTSISNLTMNTIRHFIKKSWALRLRGKRIL